MFRPLFALCGLALIALLPPGAPAPLVATAVPRVVMVTVVRAGISVVMVLLRVVMVIAVRAGISVVVMVLRLVVTVTVVRAGISVAKAAANVMAAASRSAGVPDVSVRIVGPKIVRVTMTRSFPKKSPRRICRTRRAMS